MMCNVFAGTKLITQNSKPFIYKNASDHEKMTSFGLLGREIRSLFTKEFDEK